MGETGVIHDGTAQSDGGLSRRDLIAKSAAAAGLVWAAPTLMSSPAGAQVACSSCPDGVQATLKIASAPADNCGVGCISHLAGFNFPCLGDLGLSCLFGDDPTDFIQHEDFTNGNVRRARVILRGGITLIATAVHSGANCHVATCTNGFCPNACGDDSNDEIQPCNQQGGEPPFSPGPGGVDRITVCPGGTTPTSCGSDPPPAGGVVCSTPVVDEFGDPIETEIWYDTQGRPINHIELAICIPNALTGQCP